MNNKTLVEILKQHKWDCDKDPNCGNKTFPGHTYLEVYDRLFAPSQHKQINILEIGILRGISLKLWSEYFSKANIYGFDTFERITWKGCSYEEVQEFLKEYDRITLAKVNSCSTDLQESINRAELLSDLPDNFFHVIIDDGSHELQDQVRTYNNFKSKLHPDGIYIIEDIGITNSQAFDPQDLITQLPEFKLLDMRYPEKHDNALAILYKKDSPNTKHYQEYYESKHWLTAPEFQTEYIYNKQKEQ
jgi:hypothetical protein